MNNFGKLLIVTMCLHRAQNNMEHVTEQLTYADGQMHTLLIPLNQIYKCLLNILFWNFWIQRMNI